MKPDRDMPERPPIPAEDAPLPTGWPRAARLFGQTVDLDEARRSLPPSKLVHIVVNLPGIGDCRPWDDNGGNNWWFVGPEG